MTYQPFEPLPKSRVSREVIAGIDTLTARAPRNWFIIIFLGLWLSIWSSAGIGAFAALLSGQAPVFMLVWLTGWALGWCFAASWLAWQLTGRIQIAVANGALIYSWKMVLLGRRKHYDILHIRDLREGTAMWPWGANFFNITPPPFFPSMPGAVRFDYGGRTVNVMQGLDETEGKQIVEALIGQDERLASQ